MRWIWAALIAASVALYLGPLLVYPAVSGSSIALGFPLDDAWIHQTYARNLARFGQWTYEAGRPSTGSTSPLWTLLLTVGYLLGIDYRVWTIALGMAALGWTARLACGLAGRLFGPRMWLGPVVAAFCLLEWHLVWAALSGMETVLFAALQLLCLDRYLAFEGTATAQNRLGLALDGLITGLCGGLLVLTRPEGLILLALIGLWFLAARVHGRDRTRLAWAVGALAGGLLIVAPYASFNLQTTGLLFPSTFYAKQAEYGTVIGALSLPARLSALLLTVLAGGPILLLPGAVAAVFLSVKDRTVGVALLWVWWAVYVAMYALRLPVAYQHGRYLIPTLPVLVILGVGGAGRLIDAPARALGIAAGRVVGRTCLATTAVVLLLFWAIGARAYREDVHFINGEMGETAAWLAANVPTGARLAVHDIGMVGYFLQRPFIDLAGLVTPELIPFISDERRLLEYMAAQRVEYLVVFPDWSDAYQRMVQEPRLTPVHRSGYDWTRSQGRANLTVYRAAW